MKKRNGSRLGLACKIIGVAYMVVFGLMWLYTFSMVLNSVAFVIWSALLQLVATVIPGLTLWALGVLLDRQKENRETLTEIKALLKASEEKPETEAEDGEE